MPGLTAPARRLALYLGDDSAGVLNSSGLNLVDAAIKWARGGGSLSGSTVSSPVGPVDLSATGLLDWAHWGRNGPNTFDHVPAGTTARTLKLFVGVWFSQGRLEATLSDGSAPAFVDTSLNNNAGSSFGLYTITFKAGSTGQTLKIRYTIQAQHFSPNAMSHSRPPRCSSGP